jgi:hypothetical protein
VAAPNTRHHIFIGEGIADAQSLQRTLKDTHARGCANAALLLAILFGEIRV